MAREPADRYDSAADLRAALLAAGAAPGADLDADLAATELRRGAHHPAAAPARRRARSPTAARAVVPADRAQLAGAHRDPRGDRARARDRRPAVRPVGRRRPPRRRRVTPSPARRIPSRSSSAAPPRSTRLASEPLRREPARRRRPRGRRRGGWPSTATRTPRGPPRATTTATSPSLKPGVGLVLTAEQRGELDELVLTSPTNDWSASFYVAASDPGSLEGWGEPVATLEGIEAGTGRRRPRRDRGRRGADLDHRPGRRHRRRRGHHRRGRAARACRNSVPLHHGRARRPVARPRRPSRATAPPSTRCCAATTTGSTRCAAGWPATTPTRSTPPRRR